MFLYASTFYRFKYFFSYLKKRQPQVLADVPQRCVKGNPLPVLILFKNADVFPSSLMGAEIWLDGKMILKKEYNLKIASPQHEELLQLPTEKLEKGSHNIDVKILYRCDNSEFSCINDNYRGSSKAPLPCFISESALPKLPGFVCGDAHNHSSYTDDQIEFAAGLDTTMAMAKACGLDFFAVTDHSYDLDDAVNNFLLNDPELPKWKAQQKEIRSINDAENDFCIIPGEEVSSRRGDGGTVHLLVYNCANYIEGSGDSGEKWLQRRSELSVEEISAALPADAAAFAAHPEEPVPTLQQWLLKRRSWAPEDCRISGLAGLQIINGHDNSQVRSSINYWRGLLLQGARLSIISGNDAHGHFSRNRSIDVPFLRIKENMEHVFGVWRSDVLLEDRTLNVKNIVQAMRAGRCSISNGPALRMSAITNGQRYEMGDTAAGWPEIIKVVAASSGEFGRFTALRLCIGMDGYEKMVALKDGIGHYEIEIDKKMPTILAAQYIRVEAECEGMRGKRYAFSNPVYIPNGDKS